MLKDLINSYRGITASIISRRVLLVGKTSSFRRFSFTKRRPRGCNSTALSSSSSCFENSERWFLNTSNTEKGILKIRTEKTKYFVKMRHTSFEKGPYIHFQQVSQVKFPDSYYKTL